MWNIETGKDGWPYIRMENGETKWQYATWRHASIAEEKKFLQSIIDIKERERKEYEMIEKEKQEKLNAIPS